MIELIGAVQPWMADAACRDHYPLFDDSDGEPGPLDTERTQIAEYSKNAALAMCRTCPVIRECANAGRYEEHGIWGGLTAAQRRQQNKRRRWKDTP